MHGTSAGVPITLSGMGGLVTLASPDNLPEGASPRTYDTDFDVGSVRSRAGLTSYYNGASESVTKSPTVANSSTWNTPNNILAHDGSYASISPVNVANTLTLTAFVESIPDTSSITGSLLTLYGFASAPCDLTAQLLVAGSPVGDIKTVTVPTAVGPFTIGATDDGWNAFLTAAQANGSTFGVQLSAVSTGFDLATVFLDFAELEIGLTTGQSNFQFITTFTAQDGTVKNLSLDADGNFYVEDVTNNPRTQTLALEGITPNSVCVSVNGEDVEYVAFSDYLKGSDMPLQYTANWIDRITQVGPGAAPTFSPVSSSANVYNIATITQPVDVNWSFAFGLQSNGPGSNAAGNVVTIYYADSTVSAGDPALIAAFNSGNAVYLYQQLAASPGIVTPQTVQVTSVGIGRAPDPVLGPTRPFYYYTYNVPTVQSLWGSGHGGFGVNYQQSIATMPMTAPVPGLEVGDKVTITGASVAAWDSLWTITQTPNSGQYVITSSEVVGGIATFGYAESGGTIIPPSAGQLATITGTTNAGGQLNLTNAVIVSSTGGPTGTFTINVTAPDATTVAETGLATTAGTVFNFDPGAADAGSGSDPIFGNSTGGSFTFGANAQFIANGTRQGTVFFITRNGYYTVPAVPVTFTTPTNTTGISISNIPIGPPNVVARGIAITEAGQNGVPGANFFTIPNQVQNIVNGVLQTSNSLYINDNITTSAMVAFSDTVLLNALNIGTYGYNLFNQIEIGDPGWVSNYDSRNVYGLCWNKVQNFNNLSFDGGYLPGATLLPLGWTINDVYGQLVVSPKFGDAWYIQNASGDTLATAGSISQTAYQAPITNPPGTTDGTPIINANTTYSVRVTARIPSGNTTGNLVITLSNLSNVLGTYTLPFSQMSTVHEIYIGALLTTALPTVPTGLVLTIQATGLANEADLEIDRVDVFPTAIPILTTTEYWSYAGLPEQVDSVTGQVVYASENQQPVNGAVVMYDTHYALKGWGGTAPGASLYSLQSSANLEPAQWQEPEVAQKSGAIGVLAYDFGEQWIVMANRNGLFLFEGGQPGKINHEIIQVWDAINWKAAKSIWVRNNVAQRKLLVGVPMATPNFWLPNAPVNANPQTPNVILCLNYQGIDSGSELKVSPQMHTTMFGTLTAIDMRRKWSIWQIPSPYAAVCQGAADEEIFICNGRGNSKVYTLDEVAETDDGIFMDSLYTTAGLVTEGKRAETPGIGSFRLLWDYLVVSLTSAGLINVRLLPNSLLYPEPEQSDGYLWWQVPGGFAPGDPAFNDCECSLNFAATRTFFEFRENDGHRFSLSNFVARAKKNPWNALLGRKS
jgi:hypothetical protein